MVNFVMVIFDLFLHCMLNHLLLCVKASLHCSNKVSAFANFILLSLILCYKAQLNCCVYSPVVCTGRKRNCSLCGAGTTYKDVIITVMT